MSPILKILPVLILFALGYFLKRRGILKKEASNDFLALVFNVGTPALVFQSLLGVTLNTKLLIFPLTAFLAIACSYLLALIIAPRLRLPKPSKGVFIISTIIINTGFTLPFIQAMYGEAGIARMSMFDLANATLTFTWVYAIAAGYNPESSGKKRDVARKLLFSPPVWATVLGLIGNAVNFVPPEWGSSTLKVAGGLVSPLVMISLGIRFEPKFIRHKVIISSIMLRTVLGTLIAVGLAAILELHGVDRAVLILLAASPIGFNILTFSNQEKLDTELAASIVSASVLISLLYTSILVLLLA
jgi:predicted permease